MFFGNTGTDANSTVDSILNSGNSTCAGGILDRTAYWVPALIDGTGNVILPDSAIFYYKTGYLGIKPSDVKPIPKRITHDFGGQQPLEQPGSRTLGL